MANYIQIKISTHDSMQQELLIAILSEADYEGFEESENLLDAFIPENHFDKALLQNIAVKYNFSWSSSFIDEQNWNTLWESNFRPVSIEDFAGIRADFHEAIPGVEYEIIITPKMSFGTGHHATTYLMISQMRELDIKDKVVFDFGTGTGILAILAEKMGAQSVIAIDNDEWSIVNAAENIQKNNCSSIELLLSSTPLPIKKFELILANINKNIILENIAILAGQLKNQGHLLLSGLLQEDEEDIILASKNLSLQHVKTFQKDKWICMLFTA